MEVFFNGAHLAKASAAAGSLASGFSEDLSPLIRENGEETPWVYPPHLEDHNV